MRLEQFLKILVLGVLTEDLEEFCEARPGLGLVLPAPRHCVVYVDLGLLRTLEALPFLDEFDSFLQL